jgi:hypothetical protein
MPKGSFTSAAVTPEMSGSGTAPFVRSFHPQLRIFNGVKYSDPGGIPCLPLPAPLGAGLSRNSIAGDVARKKHIAPVLAASLKNMCFLFITTNGPL